MHNDTAVQNLERGFSSSVVSFSYQNVMGNSLKCFKLKKKQLTKAFSTWL